MFSLRLSRYGYNDVRARVHTKENRDIDDTPRLGVLRQATLSPRMEERSPEHTNYSRFPIHALLKVSIEELDLYNAHAQRPFTIYVSLW